MEAVTRSAGGRRRAGGMRTAAAVAALLLPIVAACVTSRAYRLGQREMKEENYDRAVLMFSRAVTSRPDSTRYKVALSRAKMKAAQDHFVKGQAYLQAGKLDPAIAEFQQTVYLDPSHQYAANELTKALAEWQKRQKQDLSEIEKAKRKAKEEPGRVAPRLNPASNIPIVLRFKDETIRKIYDALSKASGINFIYDERLDLNKKISIDLADVTFERALDTLMTMNKHFYKIWDENTIIIADDNQQKHKELDDLVIQTFYLSNADVKDVQVLLRTLLDARQLAQNDRLNSITIRDTPDRVQVAEKIIDSNDKALSELVVDIELLELNRTMLQTLGIDLTGASGSTGKSISLTYGSGSAAVPLNNLGLLKQSGSWLLGPVPGVIVNFLKSDADAQVIAKPQVRVSEGSKATVRIGDRIPIPTTTFNAAPTVGGTVGVPITSFTYQNVGINIDIEPRVHHNKEITLKLKVEVSSLAGQVAAGGGLTQPIIGTREIDTTIRLKDNETNLLAGLIREEERKSLTGVPGLSDIPVLRRLFGSTDTNVQQTDIVLTLTPHIIRIPDITAEDLQPLWVGTEGDIGLRGASKTSAFGPGPFESAEGEETIEPPPPGLNEPEVEQGAPLVAVPVEPAESEKTEPETPKPTPTPAPSPAPTPTPSPDQAKAPEAGGPAIVSIVPALQTVTAPNEFTVSVAISGAKGVASVPFHLAFDPKVVHFRGYGGASPFLGKDGTGPPFILATAGPGTPETSHEVIVGLSRQGSKPGVSGDGVLIELTFVAVAPGTTSLAFTDLSVLDPKAQPLPAETHGATVVVN
jgi:general secretion pathway protein D